MFSFLVFDDLSRAFVTLFAIIDPIGTIPIFVSLTAGMRAADKRSVIFWTLCFSSIILTFFVFFGSAIIAAMGISAEAFKIAGGLFLFWMAFEMLYGQRQERRNRSAEQRPSSLELRTLAASPLCIPLLAGPGTMTATVILSHDFNLLHERLLLLAIVLFILALAGLTFALSIPLSRYAGTTTRIVLTRVMGVLLGALAVQIIVDGIKAIS